MSSKPATVAFLVDQLGADVIAKPMFGEYGVYFRGLLVGLVCDDRLFLKFTAAGSALLPDHESASPYPGAKPAIVVAEELWDDRELMAQLPAATASDLAKAPKPPRKAKSPKPKPRKAKSPTKAPPKPKARRPAKKR